MSTETIQANTPVGEIATSHPLATRVFARHQIDFCCGGGVELQEACSERSLDVSAVLAEIRTELASNDDPGRDWATAPLDEIIDHILEKYHAPLREELPRLDAMAQKVRGVHGDKDPEALGGIARTVAALREELESHMMKEEQVLFPLIKAGQGSAAHGPVHVMEHEHASAGAALATLRRYTNGYTVPDQACNTWRALWHGLEALEEGLHNHIHLENNILFPRALKS